MDSLQDTPARVEALSGLSGFRASLHACFTRRGDALLELADAMLCAQGPVRSPVELSLEPEFRRRHGSVYDALAKGRISRVCLRHLLVGRSAPARAGEPLMFAIDVTPHARPDAQYADERMMVQVRGKGGDRWLPGWPYSLLVGIQWGSSSWVDPIEARRLRPGEEHTDVTIDQITALLKDLTATRAGEYLVAQLPVGLHRGHGGGVQREQPVAAKLGVADQQQPAAGVEVLIVERDGFPAADAGHGHQPDQRFERPLPQRCFQLPGLSEQRGNISIRIQVGHGPAGPARQ
jgi:hypothetical protein